ncbi:MAG: squalene--hopene cyclase [Pirellulaceae bacterium]|nr:squalene--hopene cyclase [Pirellulaceae bacterium]
MSRSNDRRPPTNARPVPLAQLPAGTTSPAGSAIPPVARPPLAPTAVPIAVAAPAAIPAANAAPAAGLVPQPVPIAAPAGSTGPMPVGSATRPVRPVPVPIPAGGRPVAARPVPLPQSAAALPAAARPIRAAAPIPVPAGRATLLRSDDEAEEKEKEVTEVAIKAAPPWMVSAVLHMVILIFLGLMVLARGRDKQVGLEVVYSDELGEQLLDDDLTSIDMPALEIEEPVFAVDLMQVMDPFAAPPELDLAIDANTMTSSIEAPSIGMALTGREKGAREALLAAYGGTGKTEEAVGLGLEWLARQQNTRTGLWSLTGPYADGGGQENQLAATAMALLAFQGAGNTHKAGKYERNVSRGIEAMLRMQDEDGNFFREGPYHHHLYSQAQATIAICELYGMTKDPKYRAPAQKALDYASRIQTPSLGGWRYVPREDADTSVTGWFVMALQSGLMAGLDVQSPMLDAVSSYLDKVTKDGSTYAYQIGREPTLVMTAEALLCRQYLGWQRDDPRMLAGVRMLLEYPVDYDNDENVYYWYYATQTLHHMGGDEWEQWNKLMRERIPARQVRQGAERGSWNPGGDRWGAHGGRLFTTCLSVFNLEVYYRHLPIYKH